MTNTHTPGPWSVSENSLLAFGKDVIGCNGDLVARTGTNDDARLIAAAPELLLKLEEMVNMFDGLAHVVLREKYVQSEQEKEARNIIAKAKGE